jgi:hypothetical protein
MRGRLTESMATSVPEEKAVTISRPSSARIK